MQRLLLLNLKSSNLKVRKTKFIENKKKIKERISVAVVPLRSFVKNGVANIKEHFLINDYHNYCYYH